MLIYASLEEAFFPFLTHWESDTITIMMTSIVSATLTWVFTGDLKALLMKEHEIKIREERFVTHESTMLGANHYLNNILNMFQLIQLDVEDFGSVSPETLESIDKEIWKMQMEVKEMGQLIEPTKANIEQFIRARLVGNRSNNNLELFI